MDELLQLKGVWFDIEMQMRQLIENRAQVEARLKVLYQEMNKEKSGE